MQGVMTLWDFCSIALVASRTANSTAKYKPIAKLFSSLKSSLVSFDLVAFLYELCFLIIYLNEDFQIFSNIINDFQSFSIIFNHNDKNIYLYFICVETDKKM